MVKPSCLGVLVVSTAAGRAVVGRSATAAELTELDRDAQMRLPALHTADQLLIDIRHTCSGFSTEPAAGQSQRGNKGADEMPF